MKFKKEQTGENRISIRNEQIAGRTDPGYKRKKSISFLASSKIDCTIFPPFYSTELYCTVCTNMFCTVMKVSVE